MYFTKEEAVCPKCGNTVLLKKEYFVLKTVKHKLLPEKVKTRYICEKCNEVVVEKNSDFD